jgi:hypothetical protein
VYVEPLSNCNLIRSWTDAGDNSRYTILDPIGAGCARQGYHPIYLQRGEGFVHVGRMGALTDLRGRSAAPGRLLVYRRIQNGTPSMINNSQVTCEP